jgi:hypothetical protein
LNPSPIPLSSGIWLADQKSDYLGSYPASKPLGPPLSVVFTD